MSNSDKILICPIQSVRILLLLLAVSAIFFFPARCAAQGGPPFITDDPGTPGNNHWEINVGSFYNLQTAPGQSDYELPHVDINYGLGPRLQLKYEIGLGLMKSPGQPLTSGLSNSLAGVKWRFVDEDSHGFSLSTYPQVEFNNPTSSARRGIAEAGTTFFLPLEAARKFGPIETDAEVGYLFASGNPDSWLYGVIAGHSFREKFELFTELHGTSVRQLNQHEFLFDVGGRIKTSTHTNLLFMSGHSIIRIPGSTPSWFGYVGIQITL